MGISKHRQKERGGHKINKLALGKKNRKETQKNFNLNLTGPEKDEINEYFYAVFARALLQMPGNGNIP